jgi:hypothetical protein
MSAIDFTSVANITRAKNAVLKFKDFAEMMDKNPFGLTKTSHLHLNLMIVAWHVMGKKPDEAMTAIETDENAKKILNFDMGFYSTCFTVVAHVLYVMQFKDIDVKNVKNLLATIGYEAGFQSDFYEFCKSVFSYISDFSGIKAFVKPTELGACENTVISSWFKYRIAKTSSPQLIMDMIGDLGIEVAKSFPDDHEKAKKYVIGTECPHFSTNILAMTYTYNKVFKKELDTWHQGKNAYDNTPAGRISKMTLIFKKLRSIEVDEEKINAASDKGSLLAMLLK